MKEKKKNQDFSLLIQKFLVILLLKEYAKMHSQMNYKLK